MQNGPRRAVFQCILAERGTTESSIRNVSVRISPTVQPILLLPLLTSPSLTGPHFITEEMMGAVMGYKIPPPDTVPLPVVLSYGQVEPGQTYGLG